MSLDLGVKQGRFRTNLDFDESPNSVTEKASGASLLVCLEKKKKKMQMKWLPLLLHSSVHSKF